jgi:hypothetical protein
LLSLSFLFLYHRFFLFLFSESHFASFFSIRSNADEAANRPEGLPDFPGRSLTVATLV